MNDEFKVECLPCRSRGIFCHPALNRRQTYLYIQEIHYGEGQNVATIKVYRGDGTGYQGWQLTLTREASVQWAVTGEVETGSELAR